MEVVGQEDEKAPLSLTLSTPEQGRFVNHLSNDCLLLLWMHVAVVMPTLAVGLSGSPPVEKPYAYSKLPALTFVVVAVMALMYSSTTFVHHFEYKNIRRRTLSGQNECGSSSNHDCHVARCSHLSQKHRTTRSKHFCSVSCFHAVAMV